MANFGLLHDSDFFLFCLTNLLFDDKLYLSTVMTTEAVEQPVQEQTTTDDKPATDDNNSKPTQEETSPVGGSGTDSDSEGSVPELEEHDAAIQQMQSQVCVGIGGGVVPCNNSPREKCIVVELDFEKCCMLILNGMACF